MFLPLSALIGVILTFLKKDKLKNFGEVFIGLGILFVGLQFMKDAFKDGNEFSEAFKTMFVTVSTWPMGPILLLLIGALFTCLTQSSSATSGIVIVMVGTGAIEFTSGMYLVLGATIGTVMVTLVATIGSNINSKRMGVLCMIIRVMTALMALAIIWPIESLAGNALSNGLLNLFGNNTALALAMFLVFYNIIFIGIVLPFIEGFVKLGDVLVKDDSDKERKKYLNYIDNRLLITPTIALGQAKMEIEHMLILSRENLARGFKMLMTQDFDESETLEETEDAIDYINNAVTDYLIKLSYDATMKDERKIGAYFHIINDIERVGDHAYNFCEGAKKLNEEDLAFSETAVKELTSMYDVVNKMFDVAEDVFFNHKKSRLHELHGLEDRTDKLKTELTEAHYARIRSNTCHMELSPFYTSAVSSLERVADHLVNVGYAYINPTGDDENIKLAGYAR